MILLIDNYDSFTYNLYQQIGSINSDIKVVKNDELSVREIDELNPSHIIISPGPGRPKDAGVCEKAVLHFKDKLPILGVCLGHQAICEAFGGEIDYAKTLVHGKSSLIHIANGSQIFRGLAPMMNGARYHSLCVKRENLPEKLLIIGEDEEGQIMAIKHEDYDVYGLQFHPESILTCGGNVIIENFLKIGGGKYD